MEHREVEDQAAANPLELTVAGRPLDRTVAGAELAVHGRRVQPMARMTGFYGSDAHAQAGLAWALVRLRPAGVQVREADGTDTLVPIADDTAAAVQKLVLVGLAVAVLCWIVMIFKPRRNKKEAA